MSINYKKCFDYEGNLIQGLLIINPKINFDNRGFFQESWNKKPSEAFLMKIAKKKNFLYKIIIPNQLKGH